MCGDSCFLYGSDTYFDLDDLAKCEQHIREPIRVEENGRLRLYEEPKHDGTYVIGADPAGGVGQDDCAAVGFNARTGEQAFSWQWDPRRLAEDAAR